jgi:predicted dehydrogenase
MEKILRLGIIGLGRRWHRRYKPALRVLRSRFTIRVVCDQVQERAAREARQMACAHASGPTQLLEREDVDAVLLLDRQWFRLWPLEQACQAGKPVFCSCSLEEDDAHADVLHRNVLESRLPVMMEMLPGIAPVTMRLRELFETELGAPRLLVCDVRRSVSKSSRPKTAPASGSTFVADLFGGEGIPLLDWCAGLLGAEPVRVTAHALPSSGFSSVFLEFPGARGVQLIRRSGITEKRTVRLEALGERGLALVEWPHHVSWSTPQGSYSHVLRGQRPLTQLLLEHFRDAAQGGRPLEPSLRSAYRVLRWLRLAARSHEEGRLLPITS